MSPTARLLLTAALFASGGAVLKLCEFPSLQRAGLRAGIAALALLVLLPEARRRPSAGMLWVAPAYFGATVLFVVANSLTTAANAIFLQSTAPLWIALLGPWLAHERPQRRDLVTMLGIGAGMALFFVAPATVQRTAPNPRLGDGIAILSGVSYALLLLGMRRIARDDPTAPSAAVVWGNLMTCPIAIALMPLFGQSWQQGSGRDWATIAMLGMFQVGLAYALLVRTIPHVPALRTSLIMMIEPVLNTLVAWLVHGEVPHWLAAAGGALILASIAATSLRLRSPRR